MIRTLRDYWPFTCLAIIWLCAGIASCRAEWFEYVPSGSVDGKGIYQETKSRCPSYGWRQIANTDRPTQCHEATHFINHDICTPRGQSYGAFYVGEGRCFVVSEPNVTVAVAARYVPTDKRTPRYTMYLTGDRSSRNVLTVFDEWTCYANDAQCTQELGLSTDGGLKFAGEFSRFADVVIEAIKQHDPQYPHLVELEQFTAWQQARVASLQESEQSHQFAPREFEKCYRTDGHRVRGRFQTVDIAPPFRRSNPDGSCVNCSVVMSLRWLGMYEEADQWWSRYRGGETDSSTMRHFFNERLNFACTTDGDEELLWWAIATRRMTALTHGGAHCVNLVGAESRGGSWYAVILDNNQLNRLKYQKWDQFLREWRRCGGWAFVPLDGQVPAPTPE